MQPVRHFRDDDHEFTGHEGEWTVCGEPWAAQPDVDKRCEACVSAIVEYADQRMRAGQR